ncbi:glycoside hydrolase family 43 protein [Sphingobacterium sp. DN00404]|uniref:Glycoside hydrolase family 43 protein n=1 Tax=Sphingobacterium micropteri TaxID=2763501 RepID=A0ABR7YLG1_9SPHI|nr:glycoside hydrolase family 43 protein [Sphingobacterium micropteri]MBD1432013.1 glycoside hydrolase family 43 protein [Sphingobacterium micropteri]
MVKRNILGLLMILFLTITNHISAQSGFQNPIIRGFNPDPSICRVGDDYYLVTSSFEYFPGLPIYHSKDLINWQQIGHCLTRDSQLALQDAPASGGLFAPSLRYHDGLFYVVCTNVPDRGNFYCTAENPAGPWSDPIWVDIKSIDPDIFWDDDGKTYFVTQGDEGIRITEIDIKTGEKLSSEKLVWGGIGGRFPEAPHIYKKDGYYYLLLGEGGTEYMHSATIGRSKSLFGPYENCPLNPILTHANRIGQGNPIQGVGHADFVQAADGSWWTVFLGFRVTQPYSYYHILGRETFLAPIDWPKGGWPQINGNGVVHLDMQVPLLPRQPFITPVARTDFDSDTLGFEWQFLRNPIREVYSLQERPGYLRIMATPSTLDEAAQVSMLCRRQTEHEFRAEASLELVSQNEDEEAGLTLIQNNTHHYEVLLKRKAKHYVVQVRVSAGSLRYIAEERVVRDNKVVLRIQGGPLSYSFNYQILGNTTWHSLGALDTRYLSTEVAGGFTGVMIGLYSSSNGKPTRAKAFFDWFDYATGI